MSWGSELFAGWFVACAEWMRDRIHSGRIQRSDTDFGAIAVRLRRTTPEGRPLPTRLMRCRRDGRNLRFTGDWEQTVGWSFATVSEEEYAPLDLDRVVRIDVLPVGLELTLRDTDAFGTSLRISARGIEDRDRLVRELVAAVPHVMEAAVDGIADGTPAPALPPTGRAAAGAPPTAERSHPESLDDAFSGLGSSLSGADRARPAPHRATGLGTGLFADGRPDADEPTA